ncbi:MAG: hypothetical protein NC084_04885 [Bacteroides sp.]|nr:hypothetical protein [Bacteroides sp.]
MLYDFFLNGIVRDFRQVFRKLSIFDQTKKCLTISLLWGIIKADETFGSDGEGAMTMNHKAIGGTWDELQKELFTSEEIVASRLRVALIGELIKVEQEQEQSRAQLEE